MRIIFNGFISAAKFLRANVRRYCSNEEKEVKLENIFKNITVQRFTGVMMINIDRQTTRNSLDLATLQEITNAVNHFDQDSESQVLVIHGEGGNFSSGFDIDEMDEKGYNMFKDASMRFQRRPFTEKPSIAAVSGYAVAEGFELAMCCDLRVIEDTAQLGCLGRRFGIPQSFVGHERLVALIGLSQALDLLITGRLIDGKEAHRNGLACKVTATGTALGESLKLAKSLLKFPQAAMIIDKMAAVHAVIDPNSEDSLRDEAIMQSHLGMAIDDIKIGVRKFLKGVGKHGKFYQLSDVAVKEWELEESVEEIQVIEIKNKKKQKKKKDDNEEC